MNKFLLKFYKTIFFYVFLVFFTITNPFILITNTITRFVLYHNTTQLEWILNSITLSVSLLFIHNLFEVINLSSCEDELKAKIKQSILDLIALSSTVVVVIHLYNFTNDIFYLIAAILTGVLWTSVTISTYNYIYELHTNAD